MKRNCIHHNNLFVVIDSVGRDFLGTKATNLAYGAILETFFRVLEESDSPGDAIFYSLKQASRFILAERQNIDEKNDISEDSPILNQPVVVEDLKDNNNAPAEQKPADSRKSEKRSVIRQPIVADKEMDTSIEQPSGSDTENISDITTQVHNFID